MVQATVTTDRPIDKVSSATLEWGYTNFYNYRLTSWSPTNLSSGLTETARPLSTSCCRLCFIAPGKQVK
jgi:hypothetical protein